MRGFDLIVEHGLGFQVSGLRRRAVVIAVCFPLFLQGLEERAQRLGRRLAGFAVDVVSAALTSLRPALILDGHARFAEPSVTTLAASAPSVREATPESQASSFFSVIAMHFPQRIVSAASSMLTESPTRKHLPKMNTAAFEDRPPDSAELTPYDERHLATYLRLLDADEEGGDWKEAVKIIFGLDPDREPQRARIVYDSHLARARWMTQAGYRHLLRARPH